MTTEEFEVWVLRKAARLIADLESVEQAVAFLEQAADWVTVGYIAEATEAVSPRE